MNQSEDVRRENLKYLGETMDKLKLSQVGLGDALGISEGRISQWMAGNPIPKKRRQQIDLLLEGKPIGKNPPVETSIPYPAPSGIPIPIFGNFPDNDDFDLKQDKVDQIILSAWFLGGSWDDCYIVKSRGEFEFHIDTGDHILVKPNKVYKPGDLIVVKLGSYCKIQKVPELQPPLGINVRGVVIKILKDL